MTKVLISVPDELLDEVDRAAARAGMTRSAYFQFVAREALAGPTPGRIADALERGRRALAGVGEVESADLVRRQRDEHDAADRRL